MSAANAVFYGLALFMMSEEHTQVEFIVGKVKDGRHKVIATPTVLVKKAQSARAVSTTTTSSITVLAERIR